MESLTSQINAVELSHESVENLLAQAETTLDLINNVKNNTDLAAYVRRSRWSNLSQICRELCQLWGFSLWIACSSNVQCRRRQQAVVILFPPISNRVVFASSDRRNQHKILLSFFVFLIQWEQSGGARWADAGTEWRHGDAWQPREYPSNREHITPHDSRCTIHT